LRACLFLQPARSLDGVATLAMTGDAGCGPFAGAAGAIDVLAVKSTV
jgi:hypothetical protein